MKGFYFFLLILFVGCSNENSDASIVEEINQDLNNKNFKTSTSFVLDAKSLDNVDSMHLLTKEEYAIIKSEFPELKLNPWEENNHFYYYDNIPLKANFISRVYLKYFDMYGVDVYLLNYNLNKKPINAYKILSCGGDGGFGECSKLIIKDENIIIEETVDETTDDIDTMFQHSFIRHYSLSDSLYFILLDEQVEIDTIVLP